MNCLAHSICFLDRPWLVAGTCLPDWLGMVDRKVRLRPKHVEPIADSDSDPEFIDLARGVMRHWDDDDWFHRSVAFHEISSTVGRWFREAYEDNDGFRLGFLGHISVELLIDGELSRKHPGVLDRYYQAVEQVDAALLQSRVNQFGARSTDRIIPFHQRYLNDQFLRDYIADDTLLYRINRVLHRVRLDSLPDDAIHVLSRSRQLVTQRLGDLVSPEILNGITIAAL